MQRRLKDRLKAFGKAREVAAIRRRSASLSAADRDAVLHRVSDKTLVFAVASGRSGTQTLAKIFEVMPDVHATHEGIPAFQEVMREALQDPDLARDFLLVRKLPAIAAIPQRTFVETSHVFAKGFLPPMLALGLRPKLIFLRRDPRKIALSLERIGATPHRTPGGREHFLSPADPALLPVVQWSDFTNYQLCYWYALETMRRQRVLHDLAGRAGCEARWLRIEDLQQPADVWALAEELGMNLERTVEADLALATRVGHAFNRKEKSPALLRMNAELEVQEQQVVDRIQACLPEISVRQMLNQHQRDAAEPSFPVEKSRQRPLREPTGTESSRISA